MPPVLEISDLHKAFGGITAVDGVSFSVDEGEIVDIIGPMPYVMQQSLLENALPPNVLNYWKADFVASVNDGVIQNAIDAFATVASPMSSMLFFPIHGAARRVPVDATAYPHRNGIHAGVYSLWKDPAANDANVEWVRKTWKGMLRLGA